MHLILQRILKKKGIEKIIDLEPEEKATYDEWDRILSEGDITVEKILGFCENQINLIQMKWRDLDNSEKKNERLIALHTAYSMMKEMITGSKAERENLERHLNELLR